MMEQWLKEFSELWRIGVTISVFAPGGGLSYRHDVLQLWYILEDNDTPKRGIFMLLSSRDDILEHVCHSIIKLNIMLKSTKMCVTFEAAGFSLCNVTRSDLLSGAMSGDKFFGFMLAGSFNYAEVLSFAKQCSDFILPNQALFDQFQTFKNHSKKIVVGVCTEGQLMGLLKWVHGHQGGGTVMLSREGCLKFCYCLCYLHDYQMIFMPKFTVPIIKRMASAWYWCKITLVFDPGNLFIYGVTLLKLVAATMNESENSINEVSSAPGKLLERLVIYNVFNHLPGGLEKQRKVYTPWAWIEIFVRGIC